MVFAADLSDFFVEVAATLVDEFDVVDFLDNLTAKAAVVSGADAVGLVLSDHQGRVRFMAASNRSGNMLELLQIQDDEGPCLDCLTTGVLVVNADLAHAGDRWPVFAPRAIEAGFQSVHAFPTRSGSSRLSRTSPRLRSCTSGTWSRLTRRVTEVAATRRRDTRRAEIASGETPAPAVL